MKLPKGFGGQGFAGMLRQAQDAMTRAKDLENELANHRISVDKGPVKGTFNGVGELLRIEIDRSLLDPDEGEVLEDLIVGLVRDGFQQATDLRNKKVQEIMPNIPGM